MTDRWTPTISGYVSSFFQDPEGDSLTFIAASTNAAVVTATITGDSLALHGISPGEATISVQADDGFNPPIGLSFRVLVYPAPFPLAAADFHFDHWSSAEPAGTFPPHMLFLQSNGITGN